MLGELFPRGILEKMGVIKTREQQEREEREKLITELKSIVPSAIVAREVKVYAAAHRLQEETDAKTGARQDVIEHLDEKDVVTGEEHWERQGTVEERMQKYFHSFGDRYRNAAAARKSGFSGVQYATDPEAYSGAALRLLTIPEWVRTVKEKQITEKKGVLAGR